MFTVRPINNVRAQTRNRYLRLIFNGFINIIVLLLTPKLTGNRMKMIIIIIIVFRLSFLNGFEWTAQAKSMVKTACKTNEMNCENSICRMRNLVMCAYVRAYISGIQQDRFFLGCPWMGSFTTHWIVVFLQICWQIVLFPFDWRPANLCNLNRHPGLARLFDLDTMRTPYQLVSLHLSNAFQIIWWLLFDKFKPSSVCTAVAFVATNEWSITTIRWWAAATKNENPYVLSLHQRVEWFNNKKQKTCLIFSCSQLTCKWRVSFLLCQLIIK